MRFLIYYLFICYFNLFNLIYFSQFYWISPTETAAQVIDDPSKRFLYGINLVFNKADSSVRRGAIVKSIALFSRYHFVEVISFIIFLIYKSFICYDHFFFLFVE